MSNCETPQYIFCKKVFSIVITCFFFVFFQQSCNLCARRLFQFPSNILVVVVIIKKFSLSLARNSWFCLVLSTFNGMFLLFFSAPHLLFWNLFSSFSYWPSSHILSAAFKLFLSIPNSKCLYLLLFMYVCSG